MIYKAPKSEWTESGHVCHWTTQLNNLNRPMAHWQSIVLQAAAANRTSESDQLNLFSVNIRVHQKPSSAIFREGIRLGLVYRVRVSFRENQWKFSRQIASRDMIFFLSDIFTENITKRWDLGCVLGRILFYLTHCEHNHHQIIIHHHIRLFAETNTLINY